MKTITVLFVTASAGTFQVVAADCVQNAMDILAGASNGTTLFDCGSAFTLIAVEPVASNYTSLQSGTWWDVWAQDFGCNYCGLSSGNCARAITWSDTTTAWFNLGFDSSTKDTVIGIISRDAGFNLGYSWGQSFTKGGSWTCNVNAGDVGRLYIQNQKGWADSQTRYMISTKGCGGASVSYDPWSGYQRSNWALDGTNTVNLG